MTHAHVSSYALTLLPNCIIKYTNTKVKTTPINIEIVEKTEPSVLLGINLTKIKLNNIVKIQKITTAKYFIQNWPFMCFYCVLPITAIP